MEQKIRCQSCGMPLGEFKDKEGKMVTNFGTNDDGSASDEYCQFCYQKGEFTLPDFTVEDMIQRSVHFMTKELAFSKEEAEKMSREVIPKLKRWRTS